MRILVATDGSRGGDAAVRFAARFAVCDPATCLIVVTIAPSPDQEPSPSAAQQRRRTKAVRDSATRALQRLHVRGRIETAALRPHETIPEAIVREADRRKADLVVIGSEGRDTLREWVVSGVALRLIYLARRPVAVVRPPRLRRRASVA